MHMGEYAIETVVTAQFGLPGATQAKATGLRRPLGSRSTARGKDATERSLGCGGVPPFAAGRLCQGARMRFGMGIFLRLFRDEPSRRPDQAWSGLFGRRSPGVGHGPVSCAG